MSSPAHRLWSSCMHHKCNVPVAAATTSAAILQAKSILLQAKSAKEMAADTYNTYKLSPSAVSSTAKSSMQNSGGSGDKGPPGTEHPTVPAYAKVDGYSSAASHASFLLQQLPGKHKNARVPSISTSDNVLLVATTRERPSEPMVVAVAQTTFSLVSVFQATYHNTHK
jgi:hypothetical protein